MSVKHLMQGNTHETFCPRGKLDTIDRWEHGTVFPTEASCVRCLQLAVLHFERRAQDNSNALEDLRGAITRQADQHAAEDDAANQVFAAVLRDLAKASQ